MGIIEILNGGCQEPGRTFLVIGGFAVCAHGYDRQTVDLDILISKEQREYWKSLVLSSNYQVDCEHENFMQFTEKGSPQVPLDIMLVNEQTFSKMHGEAMVGQLGKVQVKYPSLMHLMALKLHVLRQELPHRELKDLYDVIQLVHINKVNTETDEFRQLCERFGNLKLYETIKRGTW